MFRLLLALMPFLVLRPFFAADDPPADDPEPEDDDDEDDDEPDDVEAEVQKRLNTILGREKAKQRKALRAELETAIREELEAEAERKADEEAGKFQPLYEDTLKKLEKAESKAEAIEARYREKLVRSEIKLAAQAEHFQKPEVAYKLVDQDSLEFNDEGEPTNVAELVKAIAKEHPGLLIPETERRTVDHVRSNSHHAPVDLEKKYLEQGRRAQGIRAP